MNCANHADVQATAYCRTCGKALCANCTRDVRGVIYCEDCIAARVGLGGATTAQAIPVAAQPVRRGEASPGLAALLGFIPGVGAVCLERVPRRGVVPDHRTLPHPRVHANRVGSAI